MRVLTFALENPSMVIVRAQELYGRPPESLRYSTQFEPMVTELMVDLFTVEPVMGGAAMADQREHILAALAEPITNQEDQQMSERRRLTLALQNPQTSNEKRVEAAQALRDLNQKMQASKNGDPADSRGTD